MREFYKLAEGYSKRFPEGFTPYQMTTRLLEECGEVASQVCHFEGSGLKRAKYGEPSREKLAGEIKQAVAALMQIALYYGVEKELDASVKASLDKMREEKLIN